MAINGRLKFSCKEYKIEIDMNNKVANNFITYLPIVSMANNIGGEIYFRVPGVNLNYDGTERDEFEVGDVVYWRSPKGEEKYSIAILFGNTQYSNFNSPRTSSPCVKIGKIIETIEGMEAVTTGEKVIFAIE